MRRRCNVSFSMFLFNNWFLLAFLWKTRWATTNTHKKRRAFEHLHLNVFLFKLVFMWNDGKIDDSADTSRFSCFLKCDPRFINYWSEGQQSPFWYQWLKIWYYLFAALQKTFVFLSFIKKGRSSCFVLILYKWMFCFVKDIQGWKWGDVIFDEWDMNMSWIMIIKLEVLISSVCS